MHHFRSGAMAESRKANSFTILAMIVLTSRLAASFIISHEINRRIVVMGSLMSLSVASSTKSFDEGFVTVPRDDHQFSLYYRFYSKDELGIPLVIVHGGPSLPSQYLYPITNHVDRPILFYDQLGCGKSDEPKNFDYYSIPQFVNDLECVLTQLSLPRVHLLGHSYGGNLAFEYVGRYSPGRVISLILSNSGTNMKRNLEEYDRLEKLNPKIFWKTHVCRKVPTPDALKDAMRHVGRVWGGMEAVLDYKAERLAIEPCPPTLLIRGTHDFGYATSDNWRDMVPNLEKEVVLENCAHYPHLEDGDNFGKLITDFLHQHEDDSSRI